MPVQGAGALCAHLNRLKEGMSSTSVMYHRSWAMRRVSSRLPMRPVPNTMR